MSANDNFSLHDDEELSLHDDASLDGSVPASNKGDAPAKPPQIITTNTLSNIKLPVLQKDDYDTWAMEMEHYLEYIDNEVWKVIQNGNSKKRVTKGKDGVYRVLPPTTQEEQFADEKERKARTLLLMAVPKDHLRRFHGMDDAKEIWAAIKTRFGGNANSKKMQKAVLKQQFEAFTISSKESLGISVFDGPCLLRGIVSPDNENECVYYEKKMAREAALKSKRVVHADVRQATPAWTNTNRGSSLSIWSLELFLIVDVMGTMTVQGPFLKIIKYSPKRGSVLLGRSKGSISGKVLIHEEEVVSAADEDEMPEIIGFMIYPR
ncbi:hypothetical protein Tco_0981067 [Tanacetum coccineum]